MQGAEFIETAELLCQHVSQEAHQRSATSRAYYACFLMTRSAVFQGTPREALARASVTSQRDIEHGQLKRWLKHCTQDSVRDIGHDLGDLSAERRRADYNMEMTYTYEKARATVDDARDYLEQLAGVGASPIGDQVAQYLRQVYQ